jgi:tetratricopeptide (TPR) repeat protein
MKYFLKVLFLISISHRIFASEPKILLDSANTAYSKGNFAQAAEEYEKLIADGYISAELFYNLGNAYYKLDKLSKSILNYERAKKLSPNDDDINFNLKLANQRTVDKIEPTPKLFLDEWWDSLKSSQTEKTWSLRSISCFVLFLFFIGVFILSSHSINKQFGFWLGLVFFTLTLVSFSIARGRYKDITMHNSAVILSSSAEVKNAPAESGTKLFILHEGAKVFAPEISGEWVRIELSSDKVGWVKKSQLEFI